MQLSSNFHTLHYYESNFIYNWPNLFLANFEMSQSLPFFNRPKHEEGETLLCLEFA